MKKLLFSVFTILSLTTCTVAQEIIPLYKKVPNNRPNAVNRETSDTGKDGVIRLAHVSVPTITVYHPGKQNNQHTAIIICPGGGYTHLSFNQEGTDIAETLVKWGITAIVLKYRLPDDSVMVNKAVAPLQDAQRAIQLTRMQAKNWDIDAGKIGIMGFSAGGHLAATAATHFTKAEIDNQENISLRPDFSILGYPLISLDTRYTHKQGREVLIGNPDDSVLVQKFSDELHVTGNTPPAFLVLASDDRSVNPINSTLYYEALLKNHVPAELHIYQKGGHGFGQDIRKINDNWMDRLKHWLQVNGFYKD